MKLGSSYLLLMLAGASSATAGTVTVPAVSGGGFTVNVKSLKEARFSSTVRQQYDFSCGSASVATLLTYYYEDTVSEQDVFKAMFDIGDQNKIRAHGFSLLDIRNYLELKGYKAAGYKISLEKLNAIGVPAIALINIRGYKHFVVVKGVSPKMVLLSDPAAGSRAVPRAEFESMWNGLAFLILNKKGIAQNHFNSRKEWLVYQKAPLGVALSLTELANVSLMLPGGLR